MEYFNLIEEYITGNLTPGPKKAFEEELERNADLAAAVEKHPISSVVYEVLLEDGLKKSLMELQKQRAEKKRIPKHARIITLRRILAAAASVILLAAVWAVWHANTEFSNTALVRAYTDTPNLSVLRGESETYSVYESARNAFIRGDHHSVINLLSGITESDDLYLDVQYMLGFSYLETGKPELAATAFQKVVAAGDFRKDRAEWHLVLSSIRDNDISGTQIALEAILAVTHHAYHEKARDLQLSMQSKWRIITFR